MKSADYFAIQTELEGLYLPPAEIININAESIRKFRDVYWAHTTVGTHIRDKMSDDFIHDLAYDATVAKTPLRRILRRSQYWDDSLQACKLPMTFKHIPNHNRLHDILHDLFYHATLISDRGFSEEYCRLLDTIRYFLTPDNDESAIGAISAINDLCPNVYRKGMRKTKVLIHLLKKLNLWSNSNARFNKLHNQFCEERNERDISYTLYLSLNPAHWLSMSNPKGDDRGQAGTSCHSFNGDDRYKSGCIGYARDSVSLLAFTANDAEGRLNRKTARQVFLYSNGALIQSRLYTSLYSYGGVNNNSDWQYKAFLTAVQEELARCEHLSAKTRWTTVNYRKNRTNELNRFGVKVDIHDDFGGYPDWEHFADTNGIIKLSVRSDCKNTVESFTAGAAGLHLNTAEEIDRWSYIEE